MFSAVISIISLHAFFIIFAFVQGTSNEVKFLGEIFHFFDNLRTVAIDGIISLSHEITIAVS